MVLVAIMLALLGGERHALFFRLSGNLSMNSKKNCDPNKPEAQKNIDKDGDECAENKDIICSEKVFEVLVNITQQREQDQLEQALVRTIFQYAKLKSASFNRLKFLKEKQIMFKSFELKHDDDGNTIEDRSKVQEIPDQLNQTIQNKSRLKIVKNDLIYNYFPIVVADNTIGVFELVASQELQATENNIVGGILEIYNNFLAVIRENEYDTLTGLLNRKTFDEKIGNIIGNYKRAQEASSVLKERRGSGSDNEAHWIGVIDIDHFKQVNDTYGHLYGDEVLILLSNVMKKTFRIDDLLFRYGGEEFIVVLAPCTVNDAFQTFERFRVNVAECYFPQVEHVTISIGFVEFSNTEFPRSIIEKADRALYYAKENGRNQVCNYNSLINENKLTVKNQQDNEIDLF